MRSHVLRADGSPLCGKPAAELPWCYYCERHKSGEWRPYRYRLHRRGCRYLDTAPSGPCMACGRLVEIDRKRCARSLDELGKITLREIQLGVT